MAAPTSSTAPARPGRLLARIAPWLETASAVTLSAAALATAWASYQSSLWDGEQATAYSQAEGLRTEAARQATTAGQLLGADVMIFSNWLTAYADGDDALQVFFRNSFRPGFVPVHEAWLAQDPMRNSNAPRTPFLMPEYELEPARRAAATTRQADALFERGQTANGISDQYVRATVILAGALFFGGIGQVFRRTSVRLALLVVAAVSCVWGVATTLGLPVN